MKPLSAAQQRVVDLMRDGWELSYCAGKAWISKTLQCGEQINTATFNALIDSKAIIKNVGSHECGTYRLITPYRKETAK